MLHDKSKYEMMQAVIKNKFDNAVMYEMLIIDLCMPTKKGLCASIYL